MNKIYGKSRKQILYRFTKKIDINYDSFGVIDDYVTNDNDINSAALVYDFSTLLNQSSNVSNNEILLDTFGVLLFDIYGN